MTTTSHCTHPDCTNPRWRGASGKNTGLVMCEEHQKAYWRNQKTPTERQRTLGGRAKTRAPKPKTPKADKRCKKVVAIDHKRGVFKLEQIKPLETFKQLEMVVDAYREQGYQIVEKR